MKKVILFSFITLFLMCTCEEPVKVKDRGTCGTNLTWVLTDNGVLTISGVGSMEENIRYPWNYWQQSIITIVINDSVTSISRSAFCDCNQLTSATIGKSVRNIGEVAFGGCDNLASVSIFNGVVSIGDGAFADCRSLTSVDIPNSVTSISNTAFIEGVANVMYKGEATGSPWGAKTINGFVDGLLVYSDFTKTTLAACCMAARGEIVIPNSVTSIGDWAFYHCDSLTSVTIPNSVTIIGEWAFAECWSLTAIVIPNSVTSIEQGTFQGCWRMTSITIPNSVTSIGKEAFFGCVSLTTIDIPESVTSIGERAFYGCSSLTSVTIPNSVTSIGGWAFSGCESLSITLPERFRYRQTELGLDEVQKVTYY